MNLVDRLVKKKEVKQLRLYKYDTLYSPQLMVEVLNDLKGAVDDGQVNERNAIDIIRDIRNKSISEDKFFIYYCSTILGCAYFYGRNVELSCDRGRCIERTKPEYLNDEAYMKEVKEECCYECWSTFLYMNDIVEYAISYDSIKEHFKKPGLLGSIKLFFKALFK